MHERTNSQAETGSRTKISLEQYRGTGKNILKLNEPITECFMRIGDVRANILVIKKDPLQINPKEKNGYWKNSNVTEVRREQETWLIGINDQEVARKAEESKTGFSPDVLYVSYFQDEMAKGLKGILKREKLLNSGKYNLAFTSSYLTFIGYDLVLLPTVQIATIAGSDNFLELAKLTSVISAAYIVSNTMRNGFNSFTVLVGNLRRKIGLPNDSNYGLFSNYEDPFIKHTTAEHLLPPVPIDKLIKGLIYLKKHKHELLTPIS